MVVWGVTVGPRHDNIHYHIDHNIQSTVQAMSQALCAENECKEKRRYGWCASKQKNIDAVWGVTVGPKHDNIHYHIDHNIQSTAQAMAQALCAGEHLHRVIGNDGCSPNCRVQFYVSPTPAPDRRFTSLDDRIIIHMRKESQVRERDFENFQVEERMKVIKKIH
ncbi:Phosphoglycerate mutase-like protein AT74 [Glycine soja]